MPRQPMLPLPFVDWRGLTLRDGVHTQTDTADLLGVSMRADNNLLPAMTLREGALQHNIDVTAAWCTDVGVHLAPHAKTTMSKEVIERQLRAGAWGMTAATITQVRTLLDYGVRRLILANILVNPAAIEWLSLMTTQGSDLEILVFTDSLESVDLLERHSMPRGGKIGVLVELGLPGRRTGARDSRTAYEIAYAVSKSGQLQLVGVSAYEGVVPADRHESTLEAVGRICDLSTTTFDEIAADSLFNVQQPVLSIGGSAYLDVVVNHVRARAPGVTLVLRSGCYVTHDHGLYQSLSAPMPHGGLRPALELWAHVISTPEPGLFVVGAGRRECPDDAGGPTVLRAFRGGMPCDIGVATFVKTYDHHTVFKLSTDRVRVGDVVVLGVSHPCSAFSRWRALPLMDEADVVVGFAHSFV